MNFRRQRKWPHPLIVLAMLLVIAAGGKLLFERAISTVSGTVLDAYTDEPLVGVMVQWDRLEVATDQRGEFQLVGVDRRRTTVPIKIDSPSYAAAELAVVWGSMDVRLRPNTLSGTVVSAGGQPIAGAWVAVEQTEVITDAAGGFTLEGVAEDPEVVVGAPGYRPVKLQPGRKLRLEVRLDPFASHGIYVGFGFLGLPQQLRAMVQRARELGVNTLVIDVKSDRGLINAAVAPPQAVPEAVAAYPENFQELLRAWKSEGWYLVARLVTFKDTPMVNAQPKLAVQTSRGPYLDCEGQKWLDPFNREGWEYNIALAERAVRVGFDEIQFDYTRFPSDCLSEPLTYAQEATPEAQQQTIEGFLEAARRRLHRLGATLSVDVFGLTAIEQDIGIGQVIEGVAKHVDYVSPMVYPSTWRPGSFNSDYPPAEPYRIVNLSVKRAVERLKETAVAKVRPWLQAYDDYQRRNLPYGQKQITDQITASKDAGALGWMLWDPFGIYPVQGSLVP